MQTAVIDHLVDYKSTPLIYSCPLCAACLEMRCSVKSQNPSLLYPHCKLRVATVRPSYRQEEYCRDVAGSKGCGTCLTTLTTQRVAIDESILMSSWYFHFSSTLQPWPLGPTLDGRVRSAFKMMIV